MSPTFTDGQMVLVNKLSYLFKKPSCGDIIALKDPRDQKILIKRIAKIVLTQYIVEGDNKKHSTDSRVFGMIQRSDILGKVIAS